MSNLLFDVNVCLICHTVTYELPKWIQFVSRSRSWGTRLRLCNWMATWRSYKVVKTTGLISSHFLVVDERGRLTTMHTHTFIHNCMHTYIHTYINTYIYRDARAKDIGTKVNHRRYSTRMCSSKNIYQR